MRFTGPYKSASRFLMTRRITTFTTKPSQQTGIMTNMLTTMTSTPLRDPAACDHVVNGAIQRMSGSWWQIVRGLRLEWQ
jgi:hypothetical protein